MPRKKQTKKNNKVSIEKNRKPDLIWASGHFLCESLPRNFDKWTDKKLDKFIEDNPWEPFQYWPANLIWDEILGLTTSMRRYINEKV